MKKFFLTLTLIILLFPFNCFGLDLNIESKSAILVNRENNEILYSKNEYEKLPIASLTKLMTVIVSLENINSLESKIIVDEKDLVGLSGYVTIELYDGLEISYKDLLYSTLMFSAADSAMVLANNVFSDYDIFIEKMNLLANDLGMKDTKFSNPIGKDNDNYSTSYDLYLLLDYALNNKNFYDIYTKKKYNMECLDKTISNNLNNIVTKNNLENENNIKFNGSKAGFTSLSGLSLSTISKLDDNELLLITLDAIDKQDSAKNLIDQLTILNYFKKNYSNRIILKDNKLVDTINYKSNNKVYDYEIKSNKDITYYMSNNINLNYLKVYYEGIVSIDDSFKENDKIGSIKIFYQDKLLSSEDVFFNKKNIIINKRDYRNLIIIIVISLLCLIVFRKKKK